MNRKTVCLYVLRALAEAQIDGRGMNLATLTAEIRVRKTDVRAAVSALHSEGCLDVLRMRLTLRGFALGQALIGERLPELRPEKVAVRAAA
ncbi:MAG: hypothetical protein R3B70_26575 [Polyangiaceae bacterium]